MRIGQGVFFVQVGDPSDPIPNKQFQIGQVVGIKNGTAQAGNVPDDAEDDGCLVRVDTNGTTVWVGRGDLHKLEKNSDAQAELFSLLGVQWGERAITKKETVPLGDLTEKVEECAYCDNPATTHVGDDPVCQDHVADAEQDQASSVDEEETCDSCGSDLEGGDCPNMDCPE